MIRTLILNLVKQQEDKSLNGAKQQPHGLANGHVPLTNGIEKQKQTNGIGTLKSEKTASEFESEVNGTASDQQTTDDRFHRLPKPQQEILLLHGPRQRYRLEKARDIPELRSDQEILVQVGYNLIKISKESQQSESLTEIVSLGRCDWLESSGLERTVSNQKLLLSIV